MPTTTQTINNVPVTGEIAQPALISMTGGTYPSDTWQVTVNYVNSQTTDRAFGWSYFCKVSTKGACSGGYDFGCSHLPKVKAEVIILNREGSMHAV